MALKIVGNTFRVDRKVLEGVAKEAFLHLGEDFEVNLSFVSEVRIKELNRIYRQNNQITDVLSFKIESDRSGGDVVICYKEVIRELGVWQLDLSQTAAFLLVHGILHLAGFDHTNPVERVKMETVEAKILAKKGIKVNGRH